MANTRSFKLEGLDNVAKMLDQVASDIKIKAARKAIRDAGKIIIERAQQLAPVHEGSYPSGHYQKSRSPGKLRDSISLKIDTREAGQVIGYVRVKDYLGHLLEYGHRTRAGEKLERNIFSKFREERFKANAQEFVEPQPYMRPAIEEKREEALEAMASAIRKFL